MEYKKLGDLCTITSSKRIFAEQYVNEGIPFYRSKEIIEKSNNKEITEPLFISYDTYEKIKEKFGVPQKGDILLTSVGTLGIPYIVKNEQFYFKDGNLTWIKNFSKDLNSNYLYYWILSKFGKDSLISKAIGSSQPALTIEIIKKYNVLLPKREIQDGIVDILSQYDLAIENNNKRIKILEQMAENIYKEWFVRFRFPGHEKTEFENGMPKGWKIERISDIGKVIGGGTPSTEIKEYWNGIIPWLTPADLAEFKGIYIEKGKNNITDLGLKKSSTKLLPKDTVLLSSRAPIGYVALARNEICTNQGFKSVICNEEIIKHQYLFYYFKMNKQLLEGFGSGATFLELSAKSLNKIKILVPKFELQKEFSKVVDNIFDEIFCLSNKNSNLTKQRDLLLPRLMSGKLAC